MSPAVVVTGKRDPHIISAYLPENGEVDEHSRADWRNIIAATSDELLMLERGIGKRTRDTARDLLRTKLGMPEDIALTLIEAAINLEEGFCVEADTIFEEGGIGGKRHYENFRIR